MRDKDLLKLMKKNGWTVVRSKAATTYYKKEVKSKHFPFTGKMYRLAC